MRVRARFIGGVATGENEAVVAVGEVGQDFPEHVIDAVGEFHFLELNDEGQVLDFLGVFLVKVFEGFVGFVAVVGEAFVEGAVHEALAVQSQTVEDEVFELNGTVALEVVDEFAVEEGVGVEELLVVREGEVQFVGVLLDEVVVVFAVDEVGDFIGAVVGHVHKAADAVGLLADVVVLFLKFEEMPGCETDGLCAWEIWVVSTQ